MKVLRPVSGRSRAEPCHWSEGCWGVSAGKASHNASNARGVNADKMGSNSNLVQWKPPDGNRLASGFIVGTQFLYVN